MNNLTDFLSFFLILIFLIVIHELGHFLTSKAFKIEVEEFGIFLPPRLFKLFQWGETEVTLNALPLGGFVRPKGENDPTVPGGLAAAPAWQRIVVFVAGPLMNLLVAVVLFGAASMNPEISKFLLAVNPHLSQSVEIADVVPDLPAATAGIQKQDQIVLVNGQKVRSVQSAQDMIRANRGKLTTLEIIRSGQKVQISLTPRVDTSDGKGAIGVMLAGMPIPQANLGEAVGWGLTWTYDQCAGLLSFLGKMITGQQRQEGGELLGFIGMYQGYSQIRTLETDKVIPTFGGIIHFIIQITVSLGLLNLMPIPALDGGRILLSSIELVTRRRVPTKLENAMIGVTFLLLIGLMILVNGREIINLVISAGVTATPTP